MRSWRLALWAVLLVLVAIFLATLLVYHTGGTQYAWPYLILLPVILAASIFKIPGGVAAAMLAAALLGPWMPLDVDAGVMQSTHNWLVRLAVYLAIGAFAGAVVTALDLQHRWVLAQERLDPPSGLLSHGALVRQLRLHPAALESPAHAVVVSFDVYDRAVLAMGSGVGDALLGRLGMVLSELLGGQGMVTRLERAVFAAILPGERREVLLALDAFGRALPATVEVNGVALPVAPRAGIARVSPADLDAGHPFRSAQLAQRIAEQQSRRVVVYSQQLEGGGAENLALLVEFQADLAAGRCELHLQPKLDLDSGRVIGAEALCRWHNARRGMVPPDRFIPLVETTVLVDALSRFVVERAVRIWSDWRSRGLDLGIAVNLSMHNLADPQFVTFLTDLAQRHDLPAGAVELEVTEMAMVSNLRLARRVLRRLRHAGFSIAIDDFGTGYSSLQYLKELPIDWVKLDKAFVRDLVLDGRSRAIAAATATMCGSLGCRLLAEGVETADAVVQLRSLGYDAEQGYHYARPMPPAEFLAWLEHRSAAPPADPGGFLPQGGAADSTRAAD